MKNKSGIVIVSIIALLAILCMLMTGGLVFWALNNPAISASLKKLPSTLSDMVNLQQEIISAYPADDVQVGINNGHFLTVSLVNSIANKLSRTDQRIKAREIALFVKDHDDHLNGIDTIAIEFVQQKGALGINLSSTYDYMFKLSELQQSTN